MDNSPWPATAFDSNQLFENSGYPPTLENLEDNSDTNDLTYTTLESVKLSNPRKRDLSTPPPPTRKSSRLCHNVNLTLHSDRHISLPPLSPSLPPVVGLPGPPPALPQLTAHYQTTENDHQVN